jgi:hypothetical protein
MSKEAAINAYDDAVARFINSALDTADKVGQFAAEELPKFIGEVLQWYFAYNLILFVAGVVLATFLVIIDYRLFRHAREIDKRECDSTATILGWGILGSLVRLVAWGAGVAPLINLQWLKIWIAPKLWLIEYAARLLK